MELLKNIIKEIQSYKEELGLQDISDDTILTCATQILAMPDKTREQEVDITDVQKAYLKDLIKKTKWHGVMPSTSIEADTLIKELEHRKLELEKRKGY
jgi:hypothetical protein